MKFIRKKKNKSGSVSIEILQKVKGCNKLLTSVGSAFEQRDIALLVAKAKQEMHSWLTLPTVKRVGALHPIAYVHA